VVLSATPSAGLPDRWGGRPFALDGARRALFLPRRIDLAPPGVMVASFPGMVLAPGD